MKEYHKIETIFKREEGGDHKLLHGEFRNEAVKQCANLTWEFTEKVDGTNIRIYWDRHRVQFGGRTDNAQLRVDLTAYLTEKFCTPEAEQVFEQKFGEKEVYLFGEGYGPKIQPHGGLYRDTVGLILFDVQVGSIYLKRKDIEEIAKDFGVEVVPVLLKGTINDAVEYVKKNKYSSLGNKQHELEGVVGRLKEEMFDRFGNRMIVKIKGRDFSNLT